MKAPDQKRVRELLSRATVLIEAIHQAQADVNGSVALEHSDIVRIVCTAALMKDKEA